MHSHDLAPFAHSHSFADDGQRQRERALTLVTALTLATMVVELAVGWWTGSLALTADGWHMGTHALALGGAVLSYRLSQRAARQRGHQPDAHAGAHADVHEDVHADAHADAHAHAHADAHADAHPALAGGAAGFAFGGWKIEVLAAYTSGLVLMGVALWLAFEGVDTLRHPRPVQYTEALGVAVLGLVVNLVSVWLLSRGGAPQDRGHEQGEHQEPAHDDGHEGAVAHGHPQRHEQRHQHGHQHAHGHDHNFSAAYMHVLADAFTSVLAIAALAGGAWFGLNWLDPAVALLGAVVIGKWSLGVLRHSARALVDATEEPALTQRIRQLIEADGDAKLADLHVWQVGARAWSAALSVVADAPLPTTVYRQRLAVVGELGHVTVEVHRCAGASPR